LENVKPVFYVDRKNTRFVVLICSVHHDFHALLLPQGSSKGKTLQLSREAFVPAA
jgi:hypothetical protein